LLLFISRRLASVVPSGGVMRRCSALVALIVAYCGATGIVYADTATTTVNITVCGDGILAGMEICDYGSARNQGLYSTSSAEAQCYPGCTGFAPYCGDGILQPFYGEQCDDGNNTSGDYCSDICIIENISSGYPGGGGGAGGGSYSPPSDTQVIIRGKAYPNADVHILKDGQTIGIVDADAKADFFFTATNVTPGVTTFGFWAEDDGGLKSISLTTSLTVVAGAVTTVSGAYIPPTIALDKRKVDRGEIVNLSGTTAPNVTVVTHVNSETEVIERTTSNTGGKWQLPFNTSPLENEEFHTAKALFESQSGGLVLKSAFSQAITFYVGRSGDANRMLADLNGDGKINLVDFSILLFHWGTSGPVGDLNNDRKVNLADFSIMLFYWTG
jgi:cysteine-rich repeat protein